MGPLRDQFDGGRMTMSSRGGSDGGGARVSEPNYNTAAGAVFDSARVYRYRLWRTWDATKPRVAFVMLNPSTADESRLDPTLRRCLAFAQRWGCGALEVGNLYALRSTDPRALEVFAGDVVGPDNDAHLGQIAAAATFGIIVAWGAHARRVRADAVVELLRRHRAVWRLGPLTRGGHPRHPLYLRGDLFPVLHAERRPT